MDGTDYGPGRWTRSEPDPSSLIGVKTPAASIQRFGLNGVRRPVSRHVKAIASGSAGGQITRDQRPKLVDGFSITAVLGPEACLRGVKVLNALNGAKLSLVGTGPEDLRESDGGYDPDHN
jgi:hypothetical protein